jgi:hypothetical protein
MTPQIVNDVGNSSEKCGTGQYPEAWDEANGNVLERRYARRAVGLL